MDTTMNETYESRKTSDVGFEFQKEILLHLALVLQKLDCKNFSLGYEVKGYPKFDDVVCRFEINEEPYMLFIQAKHYENKLITPKILLGKNEDFCLWAYFKSVAEIMKNHKGNEKLKFIFWTTAKISQNIWKNSLENSEFTQILNVIYNHDAKLISLDKKIFDNLDENEKYIEFKTNYENFNEKSKYFFENFIYVAESPKCEDLKHLNDMLIKKNLKIKEEAYYKFLRENVLDFLNMDKEKKRKFLTKNDFENLTSHTILDVELPRITKAFLDEFPKAISHAHNFKEESLEMIRSILETKSKIIRDERGFKLNALKVLFSIQKNYSNALLIPISKLNKLYFEALKSYDKRVVVVVDEEIETNQLIVKENLIFVGKIKSETSYPKLPPFSLNDLTGKSKENVLQEIFFELQGFSVSLHILKDQNTLSQKMFIHLIESNSLKISEALPLNKIPEPYIERSFETSSHKKVLKRSPLQKYSHCVVRGHPGMGKSATLQKLANDFKKENPEFWVEFIELRAFSNVFWEKYCAKQFEFSSEIEAKSFLLHKILNIKENSLEEKIFEFYLTLKSVRILLIFDGFDEIMPTYEKIVMNLVQELKNLNVKIFISGRLHCSSILNELETFEEVELLMYTIDQSTEYLEKKLNNEMEETSKIFSIFKKFLVSDEYYNIRKNIIETPLYLKITIEIAVSMYKNDPESLTIFDPNDESEFNELWLYNKIFEQSFDNYFEKQGIDPTSASSLEKKSNEIQRIKNLHITFANKLFDETSENNEGHSFENLFKKDETEILERGFITRYEENYEFIHQTFGEYFFATGIMNGIEKGNLDAFKRFILHINRKQQTCRFLSQMILENFKNRTFKITIDQRNSAIFSKFSKSLLLSLLFDYKTFSNFHLMYKYIWLNWEYREKNYRDFDDVPRFIEANFKIDKHNTIMILKYFFTFVSSSYDDIFGVFRYEVKLSLMKNIIFDIIKDEAGGTDLLKDINKHVGTFYYNLKMNYTKIFLKALKYCFIENSISSRNKNYFYLILTYICIKSNILEIPVAKFFNDLKKLSKGSNTKQFYNLFKSRISKVVFDKKMDKMNFIKKICDIAIEDKIVFELLDRFCKDTEYEFHDEIYANTIGYQDSKILRHCINYLFKKGYSFIESKNYFKKSFVVQSFRNNSDNHSILYHYWKKKDTKYLPIVISIFNIIPDTVIEELGASSNFGGKSIFDKYELYVLTKSKNPMPKFIYSMYIAKVLGEEALLDFLCKYNENTNLETALFFGLTVIAFFTYEDKTYTEVRKEFVYRICENALKWEGESGLISTISKIICNLEQRRRYNKIDNLVFNIFHYLKKKASPQNKFENMLVYIYFKSNEYGLSYNSKLLFMKEIIFDIIGEGIGLVQPEDTEEHADSLEETDCDLKRNYGKIFLKILKYCFEREDMSNEIYWRDLPSSQFFMKEKQNFYLNLSSIYIKLKFLESEDIFENPNKVSNLIEFSIPLNEENDEMKFLERICDIAIKEQIVFELLDIFFEHIANKENGEYDRIGPEDNELLCHCINYLLRRGFSFIDSENNSIIYYYCWKKDYIYWQMVENTLNLLPKNIFEQLGQSPHFGGRSIKEHYELYGPQKTLFKYLYAMYIARVHGEEAMTDFLCEYNERTNLEKVLTIDLKFYKYWMKNIFEDLSKTDEERNEEFVFKICENALKCEGEKRFLSVVTKTLLYIYVEIETKYVSQVFIPIFEYLKSKKSSQNCEENLFVGMLLERDEDGNILIQTIDMEENSFIWDEIFELEPEIVFKIFENVNNNGQNVFHCLSSSVEIKEYLLTLLYGEIENCEWMIEENKDKVEDEESFMTILRIPSESPFEDKLSTLLFEQDNEGRTPLHTSEINYFIELCEILTIEQWEKLLNIKDKSIIIIFCTFLPFFQNPKKKKKK